MIPWAQEQIRQINFRNTDVEDVKTGLLKTFLAYVPLVMSLSTTGEFENEESTVESTRWQTKWTGLLLQSSSRTLDETFDLCKSQFPLIKWAEVEGTEVIIKDFSSSKIPWFLLEIFSYAQDTGEKARQ